MTREPRPPELSTLQTPRLRPSTLPTIDKITGRIVTGLLAMIVVGVIGTLGVAVYRLLGLR